MPVKRTGKSRLAAMKKYIEDVHLEMRLFCLQPTREAFDRITTCTSLRRSLSNVFDVWTEAAVFKFDNLAVIKFNPNDTLDSYDDSTIATPNDFITTDQQLCSAAMMTPTRATSVKLMYVFYATGELKYIDLFYQTLGHKKMPNDSRKFLIDLFNKTKDEYSIAIPKFLQDDADHFTKYGVDKSSVDFSYFEKIKDNLHNLKDDHDNWKKLFTKIADRNNELNS